MDFSPESILRTFGYAALYSFVFAESGLFFGFFLPGDSLLFTAGILASKGLLDIYAIVIGCIICAFLGDQIGYWTGDKFGTKFFNKPGSLFQDPKNITRAEEFYEKHGKKTIVLARFVPVVRTFAPIVAGAAKMRYNEFVAYNLAGGALWATAFPAAGYLFGSAMPNSGEAMTIAIIGIIAVSFLPILYEAYCEWKKEKKR